MEELLTEENKKLITDALTKWKREYKDYRFWTNIFLLVLYIPFVFGCIVLYRVNHVIAYVCTALAVWYLLFAILPAIKEYSIIKKCNINNINTIKIGIIRRKMYKNRMFSICVIYGTSITETCNVKASEIQFNKFKINDKIIFFEYFPRILCNNIFTRKTKELG